MLTCSCYLLQVPVRDTNGQHLRDGFTRALLSRMEKTDLSVDETKEILEALTSFKALFPKSSFKAGTALVLIKQKDGSLKMEYQVTFTC